MSSKNKRTTKTKKAKQTKEETTYRIWSKNHSLFPLALLSLHVTSATVNRTCLEGEVVISVRRITPPKICAPENTHLLSPP